MRHLSVDPRCPACFMKPALCLCPLLQKRKLQTAVRVVVPHDELLKSTNTGRLLPLLLEDAALQIFGADQPPLPEVFWDEKKPPLVLFPVSGVAEVTQQLAGPPRTLVVLDGTWRQAMRLRRRFLACGVPFAQLPASSAPSGYHLRTGSFPGSRSTLEAVAQALAILEGDPSVATHLLTPFRMMVDRTLWLRGTLRGEEVFGGLPPGVSRHDINRLPAAERAL